MDKGAKLSPHEEKVSQEECVRLARWFLQYDIHTDDDVRELAQKIYDAVGDWIVREFIPGGRK